MSFGRSLPSELLRAELKPWKEICPTGSLRERRCPLRHRAAPEPVRQTRRVRCEGMREHARSRGSVGRRARGHAGQRGAGRRWTDLACGCRGGGTGAFGTAPLLVSRASLPARAGRHPCSSVPQFPSFLEASECCLHRGERGAGHLQPSLRLLAGCTTRTETKDSGGM